MAPQDSTYKLLVQDLKVLVVVGIHPYEKNAAQEVIINLEMEALMPPSSTQDTDKNPTGNKPTGNKTSGIEAHTSGIEAHTSGIEAHTSSIEAHTSSIEAHTSGIEDVVCYETVIADFRSTIARKEPFLLLEHLAQTLGDQLQKYPTLKGFRLRLEKPNIISGAKSVGIEITHES